MKRFVIKTTDKIEIKTVYAHPLYIIKLTSIKKIRWDQKGTIAVLNHKIHFYVEKLECFL